MHAAGVMALMQDTLDILVSKGTPISQEERQAAMAAALLHDIGHAPFSPYVRIPADPGYTTRGYQCRPDPVARQYCEVPLIWRWAMFNGTYERSFFMTFISSQLDMDRLDYLRRDSHFTGVKEGRIGVERILHTMCVHPTIGGPDSRLAIEWKGIYAVEKMLMARHLMYWQVYLHKTAVAGDQLLWAIARRARWCLAEGDEDALVGMTPALRFFLENTVLESALKDPVVLDAFVRLDDMDIFSSLKAWISSSDRILSDLARRFLQRDLPRCTFLDATPLASTRNDWKDRVADMLRKEGLSTSQTMFDDADYYLTVDHARHAAYAHATGPIRILTDGKELRELSDIADTPTIKALTTFVEKPYVCYPKDAGVAV